MDRVITDLAFDVVEGNLVLTRAAPGVTVDELHAVTEAEFAVGSAYEAAA